MRLSPGDTIQIILTVGGVPFAKTHQVKNAYRASEAPFVGMMADRMTRELVRDIDLYADEPALGD